MNGIIIGTRLPEQFTKSIHIVGINHVEWSNSPAQARQQLHDLMRIASDEDAVLIFADLPPMAALALITILDHPARSQIAVILYHEKACRSFCVPKSTFQQVREAILFANPQVDLQFKTDTLDPANMCVTVSMTPNETNRVCKGLMWL
jgi:hypothetical protein